MLYSKSLHGCFFFFLKDFDFLPMTHAIVVNWSYLSNQNVVLNFKHSAVRHDSYFLCPKSKRIASLYILNAYDVNYNFSRVLNAQVLHIIPSTMLVSFRVNFYSIMSAKLINNKVVKYVSCSKYSDMLNQEYESWFVRNGQSVNTENLGLMSKHPQLE